MQQAELILRHCEHRGKPIGNGQVAVVKSHIELLRKHNRHNEAIQLEQRLASLAQA